MIKLPHSIAFVAALTTLCGASLSLAADSTSKLDQRLNDAKAVYQELLSSPDHAVPDALKKQCKCVAVFPHMIKGAIGYGARYGQGVMSCRGEQGQWSPPSFVALTGGSVGFQIGAESTDLVLFFMNERGARSLMTGSKFTLGGKASVAAGPLGRSGEASTDLKLNAEIYSYAKSKGLFAGVSLEGARMAANNNDNAQYYGQKISVKQLLFDQQAPAVPETANEFRKALP